MTPSTEVRPFRIGKACQLLGETDDTITTIAQAVGFRDHSQLAREFTRAMHLTPGAHRKRDRHADTPRDC